METKWLEDFLSLAETRSFSRSAQSRRITQPAFSRRIQSLEAWAGTDLVDRSSYPTRLTAAGEAVHGQAIEILAALQLTRNLLSRHLAGSQDMVEFVAPHSLALSFFPSWMGGLREHLPIRSRLVALNEHDAVLRLSEGSSDLLLAYHHPLQPLQISADRFEMLSLGHDVLAPFAKADAQGRPLHVLAGPNSADAPIPFLGYSSGAYLARLVEQIVRRADVQPNFEPVCEADMAEGLRSMAMQGHGLAFLPASVARQHAGLARAAPPGNAQWELELEIRLYRERPEGNRRSKPGPALIWSHLAARSATARPCPVVAVPAAAIDSVLDAGP